MNAIVLTVAPIFGLIALGYALGRVGYLTEAAGKGLAEFVFSVAIPVLLFRMMVNAQPPPASADPFALWGAYYSAVAIIWLMVALATRFLLGRPARDGASIAMAAAYGNVVMLGIPIALDRLGAEAATPIALIVSLSSPVLWFSATLHMELALRKGDLAVLPLLRELVLSLLKNPIIAGMLAGLVWRQTGLGLHPIPDKMISMLGQAAIPGALVALGLSLTGFKVSGQLWTVTVICVLSLVVLPVVAWVMAFHVFSLPPVWAGVAVIFAACPPGANAFLFATRYKAAVNSVSAAVALGTALSILSVSLVLLMLHPGG
ncbi:MAG: AEC family transporter [Pseudomonadota bacterium]|nr:AEC family transporter [Pseudomonadota bacterium]